MDGSIAQAGADPTTSAGGAIVAAALPGEDDPRALVRTVALDADGKDVTRMLARDRGGRTVGVAVGSLREGVGRLDLIAVHPDAQGNGTGRALLAAMEDALVAAGATSLAAGGSVRRYAWPGVDTRYTAALALLERHGYRLASTAFDMGVDLEAPLPPAAPAMERAARAGIAVEAVAAQHRASLLRLIGDAFSEAWAYEMGLAIDQPESGGFVALAGDEVVGFSGHAVFRRAAFGPTGTAEHARGTGIGSALLLSSLHALRESGIREARIGWSAEEALPFYARVAGARIAATFWILEKRAR